MKTKHISNFIIVVCVIFAAIVSINSEALNSIALYMAIPLAFILCFIKSGKLCPNKYQGLLMALYIWDTFSYLWAQYLLNANIELHRILGAFLLTYIMSVGGSDKSIRKYLYISFIILYIGAWYYAYNNSLVFLEVTNIKERLGDHKLNANTMAYYTFFATISIYLLSTMEISNKWKKIYNIVFLLMIPLSFFVALVTASRQVLIIQIPLISMLIFERYYKSAIRRTKIMFIFITVITFIILPPIVWNIYNNSFLAVRSEVNVADDVRWTILKDAFRVGIENFPFGVGAGNYIRYSMTHHFSHCSYAELFANNGIIGLFIYCYLLFYYVLIQWKRFKYTHDRQFIVFLIFGIIYIVDQVFYVFYTDLWLIAFFVLVATHSNAHYKQITTKNNIV